MKLLRPTQGFRRFGEETLSIELVRGTGIDSLAQFFVSREQEHLQRAIELFRAYLVAVPSGGRRVDATDALGRASVRVGAALLGVDLRVAF